MNNPDVSHLLITGGTGFFGKALLRHFSSGGTPELAGARFTIFSRNPGQFRAKYGALLAGLKVRLAACDIQQAATLPEGDYTHVLHAATDSTLGLSMTPLQRFDQIVDGTRHVLDLALRCGKPRVLLTSSGGVYGDISHLAAGVGEDFHGMADPLASQNAYSVAKRMAEHLATLYRDSYGLETVIARCFAFLGEDLPLDAHFAIGNFMRDALAGRDILVQSDGASVRSYLDQRDLAEWLTVLLFRGEAGRAYNVGSAEAVSIAELATLVARLSGGKSRVRIMSQVSHGQDSKRRHYVPDISRVQRELGLSVRYSLESSLTHTLHRLGYRFTGNK